MKLNKIEKKILKLSEGWVGEKHVPSIIRGLNLAFTKSIVGFSSNRFESQYLKDHSVIVSGQYCPRILGMIPENILITLSFPNDSKKVQITEKGAKNLAVKIVRAIHHEYRHKHQQKGRGYAYVKQYRPKKGQSKTYAAYYGMPDEIDAHAHETQAEKLDINRLRKAHKVGWAECESIFMYRKHFRKTDPKVWKKFLKKVYKNNAQVQTIPSRSGTQKPHR